MNVNNIARILLWMPCSLLTGVRRYRHCDSIGCLMVLIIFSLMIIPIRQTLAEDLMRYGVTTDDPWANNAAQTSALKALPRRPTLRVVFDEGIKASEYVQPLAAFYPVSYIMGEILDSAYMNAYSVDDFKLRVNEYINTLWGYVTVWEIGNEINGEWLGSTSATVQKMNYAFDKVKERGGKTALTLYYNKDCWERPQNEMFRWVAANVPDRLRRGLDYVLVSYYEDECNGLKPHWQDVFARLSNLFPMAQLGIGETGTKNVSKKESMIRAYYGMEVDNPQFIGGYFWWFFRQDMTPRTKLLWNVLQQEMLTY